MFRLQNHPADGAISVLWVKILYLKEEGYYVWQNKGKTSEDTEGGNIPTVPSSRGKSGGGASVVLRGVYHDAGAGICSSAGSGGGDRLVRTPPGTH